MSVSGNSLLGGESDKNAEEGRLLIAKVTSRYLSELTSLSTNMNTFVDHICITDKFIPCIEFVLATNTS